MTRSLMLLLTASVSVVAITAAFLISSVSVPKSTVMITNLMNNSGGSGTILSSSVSGSQILTNSHVCEVVKNGGYIHSYAGSSFVHSYKQSELHDLCLIKVLDNLHVNTSLASRTPLLMDEATVSGHPHLLPTIVTKGHFSGRKTVQVMIGMRECTEEDMQDTNSAIFCMFLGRLPIIKTYESIVVSPTIQPGSSGSGVYNSSNEIGAVIFAGAGDFGYGLAVPYEYVRKFVLFESKELDEEFPSLEIDFSGKPMTKKDKEQLKTLCNKLEEQGWNNSICKYVSNALYLE